MPEPPDKDRQSAPIRTDPLPPLTEAEKAKQEATNTLLQYDRMVELIGDANRASGRFRLRPHVIQELNRISILRIESDAGRWRDVPMHIEGSRHNPPPPEEVPRHIDEMCEYINDHWDSQSALHLAAFIMWRLNWIHPFVDGNGRTTRAVSYYVLCSKLGFHIPGVTTIPELIATNKQPYYDALEAADEAHKQGTIDVSAMGNLIKDLLARQMVLALERAESAAGARSPTNPVKFDTLKKSDSGPQFSLRIGAWFGAAALGFFMLLILLSVAGHPVPDGAKYLIVIVLALSGGLAAAFLGGNASARGSIPIPKVQEHSLTFAVTGGIATLIILLVLGWFLFL